MAEIYYYVPTGKVDYVLECGLKLSDWYDKEVNIHGIKKKCFSAHLNPKDDINKFNNRSLTCVKLQVLSNYCHIADKYLYDVGMDIPVVMDTYTDSIVPIEEYMFGYHRLPECLLTTTVIGEQISRMNRAKDSPTLVYDSERLYVSNLIEANKEKYPDFEDAGLYYFYSNLVKFENIDKIEDIKKNIAIFTHRETKKTFVIKIPKNEGVKDK